MTNDEKAKAYDEALERFKAFKKKYYTKSTYLGDMLFDKTGEMQKDFEEIFPQLRESEDEIHRKWILEYLYDGLRKTDEQFKDHFKSAIDWLEKQKEQKPELIQHPPITYTYNSNASRDERLKAALLALLNSDLLKVKEGGYFTKQDLIEWVERIPTDKPAEWSEEDENIRKLLIWQVHRNIEDETNDLAQSVYDGIKGHDPDIEESIEDWKKCLAWLKSLRPCPSWKPSEEQIYSLGTVVKGYDECTVGSVGYHLKEMYEQLKKLI